MRGEHCKEYVITEVWAGSSPHARGAPWPPTPPTPPPGDHPRMRGEHGGGGVPLPHHLGSSPHARGALRRVRGPVAVLRIIPACAGSTRFTHSATFTSRDHPRMRGEHWTPRPRLTETRGSSPHARGAPRAARHVRGREGIIPACAGSTSAARTTWIPSRDHPRMRGEHGWWVLIILLALGSSPHARGAPPGEGRSRLRPRIIPACAGSTRTPPRPATPSRDHPRMRGEHEGYALNVESWQGSSPHARGALIAVLVTEATPRIIPACAGSTPDSSRTSHITRDHPRMRGEHCIRQMRRTSTGGSSPHARGAHPHEVRHWQTLGIIPACAGSTFDLPISKLEIEDHPRMRGEHFSAGTCMSRS